MGWVGISGRVTCGRNYQSRKERSEVINAVVSEVEQFQELTRSPVWPWKWVTEVGDLGPGSSRS